MWGEGKKSLAGEKKEFGRRGEERVFLVLQDQSRRWW